MSNTVDILGTQGTLDALISDTLTEFEDDLVEILLARGLYYRENLLKIILHNIKSLLSNSIDYNYALRLLYLGLDTDFISLNASSVTNDYILLHIIFRYPKIAFNNNSQAVLNCKINSGLGAVYVPNNLVQEYKNDPIWYKFNIKPITTPFKELDDFSTITDDWGTIVSNINNNNFSYNIGDIKLLEIGSSSDDIHLKIHMKLVGIDKDRTVSGDIVHTSWIALEALKEPQQFNSVTGQAGGWGSSKLRAYLKNSILPNILSDIPDSIKEVKKTYYDYSSSGINTANDKLWVPSASELGIDSDLEINNNDSITYEIINELIIEEGSNLIDYTTAEPINDGVVSFNTDNNSIHLVGNDNNFCGVKINIPNELLTIPSTYLTLSFDIEIKSGVALSGFTSWDNFIPNYTSRISESNHYTYSRLNDDSICDISFICTEPASDDFEETSSGELVISNIKLELGEIETEYVEYLPISDSGNFNRVKYDLPEINSGNRIQYITRTNYNNNYNIGVSNAGAKITTAGLAANYPVIIGFCI